MSDETTTAVPNPAADYLKQHGEAALNEAVRQGKFRSLSNEAVLSQLKAAKAQEMATCSEHEAVVISVPKMSKGKPELDEEGFAVLVDKRVRKHDLIARKWDARIASLS